MRAVPRGHDSRRAVPLIIAIAMVASALGLLWAVARWRRNARAPFSAAPLTHDAYDDQLDEELRLLDDD